MPTIEFVGQSSQDPDNIPADTSRLINLYRQAVGGRSPWVLKSVLGTRFFAQINGVFLRALKFVQGSIYAAQGGTLYEIAPTGFSVPIGTIADSDETTISSNNGNVTVVAGGNYYVWDGTTLTEPTAGAFSDFGDVTFMNQRTVLLERDGRRVQWSALADPTDLDALDFATTEQQDDKNLRAFPLGGLLYIFKEQSIEGWQPTATGFSFLPGKLTQRGLRRRNLIAAIPDGVFFVGDDSKVYVIQGGGGLTPISTRAVETSVATQAMTGCFFYEDEGQEFGVIRFSDRPAWCYDFSTGEWHERASQQDDAWDAVNAVEAFGGYYVGTDLGEIKRLERSNADVDGPLIRTAVSRSLRLDGKRFKVPMLEFLGRVGRSLLGRETATVLATGGVAIDVGDGAVLQLSAFEASPRPAEMTLEVSRDYAQTWGYPKIKSMGDQGDYDQTIRYRQLGQSRSFTVRVTISDEAELTLDAAATVEIA